MRFTLESTNGALQVADNERFGQEGYEGDEIYGKSAELANAWTLRGKNGEALQFVPDQIGVAVFRYGTQESGNQGVIDLDYIRKDETQNPIDLGEVYGPNFAGSLINLIAG